MLFTKRRKVLFRFFRKGCCRHSLSPSWVEPIFKASRARIAKQPNSSPFLSPRAPFLFSLCSTYLRTPPVRAGSSSTSSADHAHNLAPITVPFLLLIPYVKAFKPRPEPLLLNPTTPSSISPTRPQPSYPQAAGIAHRRRHCCQRVSRIPGAVDISSPSRPRHPFPCVLAHP